MNMPTMESVAKFKAAMDSERGALGPFMICTDPALVESAGRAGYDFVLLDMEHGTTTFQTLPNLIRAANVTGVCPVVRVPRGSDIWIDQALDVGAGAVMIPQIDTAEQARAAVSAAKFSPMGTRGTCRFVRSAGRAEGFIRAAGFGVPTGGAVHHEPMHGRSQYACGTHPQGRKLYRNTPAGHYGGAAACR